MAQNVNIPDANFKAYLVGNSAINTNADTEIQLSEASAYTGEIYSSSKNITDLTGIEAFTSLTILRCNGNSLTSIDISKNTNLTHLFCQQNSITSLDLSKNTSLTTLLCHSNPITHLDLSKNISLTRIDCSSTNLTSLDLSKNTALTSFTSRSTEQMTRLNVANGNNSNVSVFISEYNYKLECIQVDDTTYSKTNWSNVESWSKFSTDCPCTVNIPDANFKAYLVGNTAINTNNDTEIQCSEASAFTGTIFCINLSIADLTGIEAFTELTNLTCGLNQLTSLDVSQNTKLVQLNCNANSLTSLDVSKNTSLTRLDCTTNPITNLDVSNGSLTYLSCRSNDLPTLDVSSNIGLTELYAMDNSLLTLDVSKNINLTTLESGSNPLTNLDVSKNTKLTKLDCRYSSLTALDLSANILLETLSCFENKLTALDLTMCPNLLMVGCAENDISSLDLSTNTELAILGCQGNQLSSLDISNNLKLEAIYCMNNKIPSLDLSHLTNFSNLRAEHNSLSSLNVANGNNDLIVEFNTTNNPGLTCIEVDDVDSSTAKWTDIDATSSFSTDCSGNASIIEKAINVNVYPNPTSSFINVKYDNPFTQIAVLDITGKTVKTFTQNTTRLSLADLPSGMYTLQIIGDSEVAYSKFIKN